MTSGKAESALTSLRELGVEVQLNQTFVADSAPKNAFVLWTGKSTPNTAFLPKDVLDDAGLVRTDASLRVAQKDHVFAVGDVVAGSPPNLKVALMQHVPVLIKNVIGMSKEHNSNRPLTLAQIKPLPSPIKNALVVTMGTSHPPLTNGLFGALMGSQKKKDFMADRQLKEWTKK